MDRPTNCTGAHKRRTHCATSVYDLGNDDTLPRSGRRIPRSSCWALLYALARTVSRLSPRKGDARVPPARGGIRRRPGRARRASQEIARIAGLIATHPAAHFASAVGGSAKLFPPARAFAQRSREAAFALPRIRDSSLVYTLYTGPFLGFAFRVQQSAPVSVRCTLGVFYAGWRRFLRS